MKKLLFAPAALLLASCSSEPSDWRPDQKVSVDLVAPGTRDSDNFDQNTPYAPNQAKGAAITKPISSSADLDQRPAPSAEQVMSANAEAAMRKRGQELKKRNAAASQEVNSEGKGNEADEKR